MDILSIPFSYLQNIFLNVLALNCTLIWSYIFREMKWISLISKFSWFLNCTLSRWWGIHELIILIKTLLFCSTIWTTLIYLTDFVSCNAFLFHHWSVHLVILTLCSRRLNSWSTRIRNLRRLFQKQHQHSTRAEVSRFSNYFLQLFFNLPAFFLSNFPAFKKFWLLGKSGCTTADYRAERSDTSGEKCRD